MKHIDVITLFPELFFHFMQAGILGRAGRQGKVLIKPIALRNYGLGMHKQVDDLPYGGGAGMLLRPEPLIEAIQQRTQWHQAHKSKIKRIMLTPQGNPLTQKQAQTWADESDALILICGRYEGIDHRVQENWVDECCSIGDFICFGGEIPAMALIESVVRLLPGVLGNDHSCKEESFSIPSQLEYPQYTRPQTIEGHVVPPVLLSGNHLAIAEWRSKMALALTEKMQMNSKHIESS